MFRPPFLSLLQVHAEPEPGGIHICEGFPPRFTYLSVSFLPPNHIKRRRIKVWNGEMCALRNQIIYEIVSAGSQWSCQLPCIDTPD